MEKEVKDQEPDMTKQNEGIMIKTHVLQCFSVLYIYSATAQDIDNRFFMLPHYLTTKKSC